MNYSTINPCTACGLNQLNAVCFHHVYTRGAYPEYKDREWNKMPLCKACHSNIHSVGLVAFAKKHLKVALWLISHGWELDEYRGKWTHENN